MAYQNNVGLKIKVILNINVENVTYIVLIHFKLAFFTVVVSETTCTTNK